MVKKVFGLLLILVMVLALVGCGEKESSSSKKDKKESNKVVLSGKYEFGEEGGDVYVYYDCNSKSCKWHAEFDNKVSDAEYSYTMEKMDKEEDPEFYEKYGDAYIVYFEGINGAKSNYNVMYVPKINSIYDPELDITYEK